AYLTFMDLSKSCVLCLHIQSAADSPPADFPFSPTPPRLFTDRSCFGRSISPSKACPWLAESVYLCSREFLDWYPRKSVVFLLCPFLREF
uniref:Uncharacterized protein n=1 Tax=Aquila chrysaetos chrysaetos TaxID=223781 RepID=A0A663DJM0_AQUCH